MKSLLVASIVTVGMLAAVACGKPSKDDEAGKTNTTAASVGAAKASCDMSGEIGSCNEYRNGSSFGLEKSLCEGFKGKFTQGSGCATTNQVGSCALSDGEVKRYYGAAIGAHGFTLDEAKADCESDVLKGKFTADPNAAAAAAAPKKDEPAPKAAAPAAKAAAPKTAAKKK